MNGYSIMIPFKNILVPTDFSKGFDIALNCAIGIAKSMSSVIHIIHVVEPMVYPADKGFSQVCFAEIEKELENNAYKEMEKIIQKINSTQDELSCTNAPYTLIKTKVLFGKTEDQIIEYAEKNDIDLICIATHGRSGFQHLLFGSTTEKVLRRAKCPVLAVKMKCKK